MSSLWLHGFSGESEVESTLGAPPNCAVVGMGGMRLVDACMCTQGALCKKPVYVITDAPELEALSVTCDGRHTHEVLRGSTLVREGGGTRWRSRTSLDGVYPLLFCDRFAHALRRRHGSQLSGGGGARVG